jgi:uncharacterized membrane protein YukC
MITESPLHSQKDIENSINNALINDDDDINENSMCRAAFTICKLLVIGMILFILCIVFIIFSVKWLIN